MVVTRRLSRVPTKLELEAHLCDLEAREIYKQPAIQRKGNTVDKVPVTEAIADILLRKDMLSSIQKITREASYFAGHSKEMAIPHSNRKEEILAIELYKTCSFVVDYQVPLKSKQTDIAGKIDLLLQKDDALVLGELKAEKSEESLLRAVLEVETYWRILDKDKLLKDFARQGIQAAAVKKAIIIFRESRQAREFENPVFSSVVALMKLYGIKVICADDLKEMSALSFGM